MGSDQTMRLWAVVAWVAVAIGAIAMRPAFVLLRDVGHVDAAVLQFGCAGAFTILAGLSLVLGTRMVRALGAGVSAAECKAWAALGYVSGFAGLIVLLVEGYRARNFAHTLNQTAVGLAASFAIMAGIASLTAAKVMHLARQKSDRETQTRGAGA